MRRILLATVCFFGLFGSASAAEFCLDRYNDRISAVDAGLAATLKRLDELQTRLIALDKEKDAVSKEMTQLIKDDPGLQKPETKTRLAELTGKYDNLDREEAASKSESYDLQDRATSMRTVIPADLQGELRGCIEASKPATTVVNTVIQTLAILTTGGAALALPEKSLYVDMSAVLNGYPFGGDQSAINKGRQVVLDALGIGGENNDLGKIIKDPGRVVRCWFGC